MTDKKAVVAGAVVAASAAFLGVRALLANARQARLAEGKVGKGVVTQLWVHPVKGCSGTPVESVEVVKHGFKFDREWGIFTTKSNTVLSTHSHPVLKLVMAHVDVASGVLVVSVEGGPNNKPESSISVPLSGNEDGELVTVKVSSIECEVRKESNEAAKFLTEFIGEEVYLARLPTHRLSKKHKVNHSVAQAEDKVKLQSFSTVHIVSEEGLEKIRKASGVSHFKASTTRPNIVVSGFPNEEEDSFDHIHISDIKFRFCRWTTRCPLMNIRDDGTINEEEEPLKTIKKIRSCHNVYLPEKNKGNLGGIVGINMFHDGLGTIRIGDEVVVDQWKEGPVFVDPDTMQ